MAYRIYLLLPVLFAWSMALSQVEKKDSLLIISRTAQADTSKVWALMETGKLFLNNQLDTALFYLDKALNLAESIRFERGVAKCRINKAYVLIDKGNLDEAIALLKTAVPLCEKLGMKMELVATYNNMGNAWNYKGSHWLAIESYQNSLEAMKGVKVPPHFPLAIQSNLAILYNDLKLYDKGLKLSQDSYKQALDIEDDQTAATAAQQMANALKGLGNSEESLSWYEKAVEHAKKVEFLNLIASSLSDIADINQEKGNLDKAESIYREALALAQSNSDKNGMMLNLHGLSIVNQERKDWVKAEAFAHQALDLAIEMKVQDYAAPIYLTLSDIKLVQGDMKAWSAFRREYFNIRDTLANASLIHALEELDVRYETEKKEQQILQLEQEKELQRLRLHRQRALFWGAAVFSMFMLAGGLLTWRFQRNREILAEQQLHIQQQTIKQLEQEKQIATAKAVLRGQEEERGRLARDLHDGLGGMLSGIKQTLFAMKGNKVLSEASAIALNQVITDMDRSIGELRHIARNMMPEALVRFGLKDALQDYCDHTRQATKLELHFQAFGMDERLPEHVEVIIFRIAQELLNNVVKHAHASKALVQLIRDGERLSLTVEDNGKGMDTSRLDQLKGVGWMNIRSRVSYLEGTLDLRSSPGEGTSVNIEFQLT